jgi:hypothetical protein
MPGYNAGLYDYDWPGSPVGVSTTELNPPAGATVVDTVTPAIWFKISPLGDNSNYQQIAGAGVPGPVPIITPVSPLTGATVNMNTQSRNETIDITPAGTIAALTVVFPANAASALGQIERIVSSQTVTTLTVTANSNTINGTAVTTMVAGTVYGWQKVAASTWNRI